MMQQMKMTLYSLFPFLLTFLSSGLHAHKCSLPQQKRLCFDSEFFMYDEALGDCKVEHFVCPIPGYTFTSYKTCADHCMQSGKPTRCLQPKLRGPCLAIVHKFYFNKNSTKCEPFQYGGCQGNENNFDSLKECQEVCKIYRITQTTTKPRIRDNSTTNTTINPVSSATNNINNTNYNSIDKNSTHSQIVTNPTTNSNNTITNTIDKNSTHSQSATNPTTNSNNTIKNSIDKNLTHSQSVTNPTTNSNDTITNPIDKNSTHSHRATRHTTEQDYLELDLNISPRFCSLPFSKGYCQGSYKKYFYSFTDKQCKQFDYSGCGGNRNRFSTSKECEATCGDPCKASPPVITCPKSIFIEAFYYDQVEDTCRQFEKGSCTDISTNHFRTKEHCQNRCVKDTCKLNYRRVTCKGQTKKVYFDSETGSCVHIDRGCLGVGNSFPTIQACQNKCEAKSVACDLTLDEGGPCNETDSFPYFYYDRKSKTCKEYSPGQCADTENKFSSHRQCSWMCEENPCVQGPVSGSCDMFGSRYFYNVITRRCETLPNGKCGSDSNGFEKKDQCENTCASMDICKMPLDPGMCNGVNMRWHYQVATNSCESFVYTGCGGNDNNFLSEWICQTTCLRNPCQSPKLPVRCNKAPQKTNYYFDMLSGTCRFGDSNCFAEGQLYPSLEQCQNTCVKANPCLARVKPKPCRPPQVRYFHDSRSEMCIRFHYTGCGGNANNYRSIEECQSACQNRSISRVSGRPSNQDEMAGLSNETNGPLLPKDNNVWIDNDNNNNNSSNNSSSNNNNDDDDDDNITATTNNNNDRNNDSTTTNKYNTNNDVDNDSNDNYEDNNNNNDENDDNNNNNNNNNINNKNNTNNDVDNNNNNNNSSSSSSNNNKRNNYDDNHNNNNNNNNNKNKSREPEEKQTNKPIYFDNGSTLLHYDPTKNDKNSHPTRKYEKNAYLCLLSPEFGSCNQPSNRFYFDPQKRKCLPFVYNGCQGNANNFETLRECEELCFGACREATEITEDESCNGRVVSFFYNSTSKMCEKLPKPGCSHGLNGFHDLKSCEKLCASDVCFLRADPGPCEALIKRFYYDPKTDRCLPFTYGGCNGNGNRFVTYEDCKKRCFSSSQCSLSPDQNICYVSSNEYAHYFFNQTSARCEPTNRVACDSRCNNFETLADCTSHCEDKESCLPPEKEKLTCNQEIRTLRYFYNSRKGACEKFPTCAANGWATLSECNKKCSVNICDLPKERGPCNVYSVNYYFDKVSKQCRLFFYGGCKGNQNNFKTIEECVRTCEPERCDKPLSYGTCGLRVNRYFYDNTRDTCIKFVYSGCGSSPNNFASLSSCQKSCVKNKCKRYLDQGQTCQACLVEPEERSCSDLEVQHNFFYNAMIDECEYFPGGKCGNIHANSFVSREECKKSCRVGVCEDDVHLVECSGQNNGRFYYNIVTDTCAPFEEGKCNMFGNRFFSLKQCEKKCVKDICHLKKNVGGCESRLTQERIFYNHVTKKCEPFLYGGCGNENNFLSREECEEKCVEDPCKLHKSSGHCLAYSLRYFFNLNSGQCEEFIYGGCGGNANNFPSREACSEKCQPNVCILPVVEGPCKKKQKRFYYDSIQRKCASFNYGGCKGNGNNFRSIDDCNAQCVKYPCSQPLKIGRCKASIERFFFNKTSGKCERFYFGGCEANANNFMTAEDCNRRCSANPCELSMETGTCTDYQTQFYFDAATSQCQSFNYGGCGGNANRFSSREQCAEVCIQNRCELLKEPGSGAQKLVRYFFDMLSGNCEKFLYTGYGGNTNNFRSMKQCESVCLNEDFCLQPKMSGPCRAAIKSYYYDPIKGSCRWFDYGGCRGNKNNFLTHFDCIKTCKTNRQIRRNKCFLLKEQGLCSSQEERFYFDRTSLSCEPFNYTGCGGNGNNFLTKGLCERECHFDPCSQEKNEGYCRQNESRWFYDKKSGLCQSFKFNGCGGNQNNFKTLENCERKCLKPSCRMQMAAGSCYNNLTRFYYNWDHGRCYQFSYTGCGGNENRFLSMKQCEQACFVDRCLQPLIVKEKCTPTGLLYFYNRSIGACQAHNFRGCQINENHFRTLMQCQQFCSYFYKIDRRKKNN